MATRSRPPSERGRWVRAAGALAALVACACGPAGPKGVPPSQLDTQVAQAIGDPATCLLLANAATGQVVYRYGTDFNCDRALPACDAPSMLTARRALSFAGRPGGRLASCPSVADGSRSVGWAAGKVQSAKHDLEFSAVMEGPNALPGHEMNARLYDAFQAAGL